MAARLETVRDFPTQLTLSTTISQMYNCESSRATQLLLMDLPHKMDKNLSYVDIGGSYNKDDDVIDNDLWFFYTSSCLPEQSCLLNLFVIHRNTTGNFSIGISDSDKISHRTNNADEKNLLSASLKWQAFKTLHNDHVHHLATYYFTKLDVQSIQSDLLIPISIDMNPNPNYSLNDDIIKIKLNHNLNKDFTKDTDFVIKTRGEEFKVNKLLLLLHCPGLRKLIKNETSNTLFIDIEFSSMVLLLEFIYTGTIKDMENRSCLELFDIAARFEMENLSRLAEVAVSARINTHNAVDIAILSEKYKLEKLQESVFKFIQENQCVLETEGFKNLDNVHLAKKLLQFMIRRT